MPSTVTCVRYATVDMITQLMTVHACFVAKLIMVHASVVTKLRYVESLFSIRESIYTADWLKATCMMVQCWSRPWCVSH